MKKKLLALSAALALGLPIFSAFYMCVKLDTSDIFKFEVEDIEEVTYDTTPAKKNMYIVNKACDTTIYNVNQVAEIFYEKIADTTLANVSDTPLTFRTLTDSTAEVSGYIKEYFTDEDGIIEEKEISVPANIKINDVVYSVTGIGKDAFLACPGLIGITLPTSIVNIDSKAFSDCKRLKEINIPSSVVSIGEESFQNCTGLTSLLIPSSVTKIDGWAFNDCSNLEIVIDNAEENLEIGQDAFYGCKLVTFTKENSPVEDPSIKKLSFRVLTDSTAEVAEGCMDTIVIPETVVIDGKNYKVTSIGDTAFAGCFELKSIVFSSNITTIGEQSFMTCANLVNVKIPSNVTEIKDNAFYYCKKADIVVDNYEDCISLGKAAFFGCNSVTYTKIPDISEPEPEDTTPIIEEIPEGQMRFKILSDSTVELTSACLDTINIPDTVRIEGTLYTVTSIGNSAFFGCDSVTSITIPESVNRIGNAAFAECTSLTSVTIPSGVTTLNDSLFYGCDSLSSIVISENVKSIGAWAFFRCTNLDIVIDNFQDSLTYGNGAFEGCKSVKYTKIDPTIVDASATPLSFKVLTDSTAEVTKSNASKVYGAITVPLKVRIDGKVYLVNSIGDNAFERCERMTSIVLSDSITSIGNSAFNFCKTLTTINLPANLTTIGDEAFIDCVNLMNVTIPASVTKIGTQAFAYCSRLNAVVENKEENIEIGDFAFYEIKSLKYQE